MEHALASYERAGDTRQTCLERGNLGYGLAQVGQLAEAATELRAALEAAGRMGLAVVAAAAGQNLGLVLGRLGNLEEARAVETRAALASAAQGDRRQEAGARVYLGTILALAGDLEAAERETRRGVELLTAVAPPLVPFGLATLARVLVSRGRPAEALEAAARAHRLANEAPVEEGEALIQLAYAEALDATGDRQAARAALREAHARLRLRASKISSPARRRTFLDNVPEHSRTLELARTWLGAED